MEIISAPDVASTERPNILLRMADRMEANLDKIAMAKTIGHDTIAHHFHETMSTMLPTLPRPRR